MLERVLTFVIIIVQSDCAEALPGADLSPTCGNHYEGYIDSIASFNLHE